MSKISFLHHNGHVWGDSGWSRADHNGHKPSPTSPKDGQGGRLNNLSLNFF
jgi:hypothetical protein